MGRPKKRPAVEQKKEIPSPVKVDEERLSPTQVIYYKKAGKKELLDRVEEERKKGKSDKSIVDILLSYRKENFPT